MADIQGEKFKSLLLCRKAYQRVRLMTRVQNIYSVPGIRSLVLDLKMDNGRMTFQYVVEIKLNPIFICNNDIRLLLSICFV